MLILLSAMCHRSGVNCCMSLPYECIGITSYIPVPACDKHWSPPRLPLTELITACVCLTAGGFKVNSPDYVLSIYRSKEIDTCFDGVELVEDRYIGSMSTASKRVRCNERGACVGRK